MSIQDPTAVMVSGLAEEIMSESPLGASLEEMQLEADDDLMNGGSAVVTTVTNGAAAQAGDPSTSSPSIGRSPAGIPVLSPQATPAAPALPGRPLRRPIPSHVRLRLSSGRYRSAGAGFQLELRVDVDGAHPVMRVSGDFFQATGLTVGYFGSFVVNAVTVSTTPTTKTTEGLGTFTFAAGAPKVRVTIPRAAIFSPAPSATVQFFTTSGAPGAIYVCRFQSPFMRTVKYDQDITSDAIGPAFTSYDTGSLPSGGPARAGPYTSSGAC